MSEVSTRNTVQQGIKLVLSLYHILQIFIDSSHQHTAFFQYFTFVYKRASFQYKLSMCTVAQVSLHRPAISLIENRWVTCTYNKHTRTYTVNNQPFFAPLNPSCGFTVSFVRKVNQRLTFVMYMNSWQKLQKSPIDAPVEPIPDQSSTDTDPVELKQSTKDQPSTSGLDPEAALEETGGSS